METKTIIKTLETAYELVTTLIPCDEYEEITRAQILNKIGTAIKDLEKEGQK
jgi:hypothetical protein